MRLKELRLKNFRCFEDKQISLEGNLVLVRGHNGSGKSTLLEAMYYLGYLHSFRTHNVRDLIRSGQQDFFIKASLENSAGGHDELHHDIQVGFSDKRRVVKINQKAIGSYKELMAFYRILSLTEDDLALVRGEPEQRRSFVDQTLMFVDEESTSQLRSYRAILHHRNKLLYTSLQDEALLRLWTQQLWNCALIVQQRRQAVLQSLNAIVQTLGSSFFGPQFSLRMEYLPKIVLGENFEEFCEKYSTLFINEKKQGRSLFGAHLDDITLYFNANPSRFFASRGQQKCIVTLLKVAQLHEIMRTRGSAILLLDDFMTDFDRGHIETLVALLLHQNIQLIFTVPSETSPLIDLLIARGAQCIDISN